ncbi:MAG TPA: hypothetical protein EYO26_01665 [Dehalococcoidia bacterium]|nr:hypothetical protein [Dehalococcoidia bacterium]
MYGTIFNLNVKTDHKEKLIEVMKNQARNPEGLIAWFLMNPDDDEDLIGVAVFENKDAHLANANNPDQHEYFMAIMEHLNSEPTWTDGEYVAGQIVT